MEKKASHHFGTARLRQLVAQFAMLVALTTTGCAVVHAPTSHSGWNHGRVFDLTHAFGADTIVWPTERDFRLVQQYAEDMPGGYFYTSNRLEMPEHGGTHIDAPIHFVRGAQTLDQIPLEHLMGAGARITVAAQCANDRDYRVTIADVEEWKRKHGKLPDGMIVLLDTGFSRYWPSRKEYLGTDMKGTEGSKRASFPGIASGYGSLAGTRTKRQGRRDRHRFNRLWTIHRIRNPCTIALAPSAGVRESC